MSLPSTVIELVALTMLTRFGQSAILRLRPSAAQADRDGNVLAAQLLTDSADAAAKV